VIAGSKNKKKEEIPSKKKEETFLHFRMFF